MDARNRPVAGARVEWWTPNGGGTVEPSIVLSDSVGTVEGNWTLGKRAGAHSAFAVLPEGDSVRFSAMLSPSELRVTPNPLVLWAGDTIDVVVSFVDSQGIELDHDPVEWVASTAEHVEAFSGTQITAIGGEGQFELMGSANGVEVTIVGTVGSTLYPVVLPVNHQLPDDSWAFLRIDSCIDSVAVASDGETQWRLPVALSEVPEWEYLVDRAGSSERTHFPSIARNPEVLPSGRINTIVTPVNWEFSAGSWEGYRVPVSLSRGMNLGEPFGQVFIRWRAHFGQPDPRQLFSWPEDRYPIPVYLDHYGSPEGIPPADSVTIWNYLRDMEARMGFEMFQPVTAEDVPTTRSTFNDEPRETPDGDAVAIRFSGASRPASGGSSRVFCEDDGCLTGSLSRGSIDMVRPIWIRGPATMQHEMLHVLGMGHTCMWPTTMVSLVGNETGMLEFCSRWRIDFPEGMDIPPGQGGGVTAFDTATWLAFHSNLELLRGHPGAMALWETVYAENMLILGEGLNELPRGDAWTVARSEPSTAIAVSDPWLARFCGTGAARQEAATSPPVQEP